MTVRIPFIRQSPTTLAALCGVILSWQCDAMDIIAHRGASFDAPENTLASMKLAWEQGADAVELDIWLSKDGKLIVFHDADTKRIGGGGRKISDLTWDEAQQLDVGSWKGAKYAGERIPSLDSILASMPAGKRTVIEIKCGPEVVPELVRVVRASGRAAKEMAVISFNYESLRASQQQLTDIEHYLLAGYRKDPKTGEFPALEPLIAKAKESGFAGLDLNFEWPIDAAFVSKLKDANLKLITWTVDDPEVAKKHADLGAVGVTTNRPGWLRERVNSR